MHAACESLCTNTHTDARARASAWALVHAHTRTLNSLLSTLQLGDFLLVLFPFAAPSFLVRFAEFLRFFLLTALHLKGRPHCRFLLVQLVNLILLFPKGVAKSLSGECLQCVTSKGFAVR